MEKCTLKHRATITPTPQRLSTIMHRTLSSRVFCDEGKWEHINGQYAQDS